MSGLVRHPDWQTRLIAYLSSVAARPFEPGHHDCMLFVAGCIEAMTGTDLAKGFRGYRSLAEGQRLLVRRGYRDHVDLVASLLEECPVPLARRGDVAVLEEGPARSVGLVQGARVYVLGERGIGTCDLLSASRAFRV